MYVWKKKKKMHVDEEIRAKDFVFQQFFPLMDPVAIREEGTSSSSWESKFSAGVDMLLLLLLPRGIGSG